MHGLFLRSNSAGVAVVIHSDFEKGFIRAEIIEYGGLVRPVSDQMGKTMGCSTLKEKSTD